MWHSPITPFLSNSSNALLSISFIIKTFFLNNIFSLVRDLARLVGFEPTNTGVKTQGVYHFATALERFSGYTCITQVQPLIEKECMKKNEISCYCFLIVFRADNCTSAPSILFSLQTLIYYTQSAQAWEFTNANLRVLLLSILRTL